MDVALKVLSSGEGAAFERAIWDDYDTRAEAHGSLRPVVERVLRGFMRCGLVEHGFARAWCNTCRASYLIPYSCRGRNFCPSPVIYKGLKHNPTLGRNFETMDPWLARMSDHIPDPGRHRTHFYAYYAHRVRGDRAAPEPGEPEVEEKPAKKRRCHVDPLTCAKCGGKLAIIAYLHDQVSISRILDHLGLGPPETAKPPPALHEVVRVPVDEEGREIEAP